MGKILKDCFIEIDAVDMSALVAQVEVNQNAPDEDGTTFGSGGRSRFHGLRDDSFVVTFLEGTDETVKVTLQGLIDAEEAFDVAVRAHAAAASATNVSYEGSAKFFGFAWGGTVGNRDEMSATFPVEGQITTDDGSV